MNIICCNPYIVIALLVFVKSELITSLYQIKCDSCHSLSLSEIQYKGTVELVDANCQGYS